MKKHKDILEAYINKNKESFETSFDEEKVWNSIENKLSSKKEKKFNWFAAATILLALALGWLVYDRAVLTDKVYELESLMVNNRPFSEIEQFYQQHISEKSNLVNDMIEHKDLAVNSRIAELQNIYNDLKKQIKEQGPHPQLVNALVKNLQMQIEILEQQIYILQDLDNLNNQKNRNHETSI